MSESTEVKHDPSCPYGDEFSITAPEQCMPCALIRKVRSETLDTVHEWLSDTTPPDVSPDMPSPDREAFMAGYQLGRVRDLAAVSALRGTKHL